MLMPMFTYQVARIIKEDLRRTIGSNADSAKNFQGKVTTITLVEIPFMNCLDYAKGKEKKTVIWYDPSDKSKDAFEKLSEEKKCPFYRETKESEVLARVSESIRTTIIIYDAVGFDLIRQYLSGFNLNNSILNIAFYSE